MLCRISTALLLLILEILSPIYSSIIPQRRPLNISHFLYPQVTSLIESSNPPPQPKFLQGVLSSIARKEKCALEDVRISALDVNRVKYMSVERYQFQIRVGKTEMVLTTYEQVSDWKKLVTLNENATSNFEDLAIKIGSRVVIDSLKVEGPFELRVSRKDDQLSLILPSNTSHYGLRRISVGEGITVEIKDAEEISTFLPSNYSHSPYAASTNQKWNEFGSIWQALCNALLPVHITGSASVVAYRSQRPAASIQTAFPSKGAIELLPEKCFIWPNYMKPMHPFSFLSSKITLERDLEDVLKQSGKPGTSSRSLKARVRASHLFRFQLEVEIDIRRNDSRWSTIAEWRTWPTIEHLWFEVFAMIEGNILKPLVVRKVRPFINTDSLAWNSLLSNISFTKFPSALVPPEALTLDVKW